MQPKAKIQRFKVHYYRFFSRQLLLEGLLYFNNYKFQVMIAIKINYTFQLYDLPTYIAPSISPKLQFVLQIYEAHVKLSSENHFPEQGEKRRFNITEYNKLIFPPNQT
jgi:hypothetical protein